VTDTPHVGDGYVANVAASPGREQDRTPEEAAAVGHLTEDPPPAAVDLQAPWYTVGDQGKTGSCVGWALADSVVWRQLVRKGRLAEEDRLSPRFLWMAAKEVRTKATEADLAPGRWWFVIAEHPTAPRFASPSGSFAHAGLYAADMFRNPVRAAFDAAALVVAARA